jgi:hypothetical protein
VVLFTQTIGKFCVFMFGAVGDEQLLEQSPGGSELLEGREGGGLFGSHLLAEQVEEQVVVEGVTDLQRGPGFEPVLHFVPLPKDQTVEVDRVLRLAFGVAAPHVGVGGTGLSAALAFGPFGNECCGGKYSNPDRVVGYLR